MVFEEGQCPDSLALTIGTLGTDYWLQVSFFENALANGFRFRASSGFFGIHSGHACMDTFPGLEEVKIK